MATSERAQTTTEGSGRGRLIGLAVAVIGVVVLFRVLPADAWLLGFVAWIREAGATGMAVFVAAYVVATVLFLPGSILTLGAGFAYGVVVGTPLVWVAANVGAALAFLLGRTLARDAIARRVEGNARFAAIDRAVGREGLKIVLLTRLSPVFPFNLLNYAYGLTTVSLRDFVVGSVVGMLPGTLMYVYLGSLVTSLTELTAGRTEGETARWVLYFVGLVATIAVTVVVTRLARRALDEATREQETSTTPAPGPAPFDPDAPLVLPEDEHNRELLRHVHPPRRANPQPRGRYNLVVVGGGTAGLVSAAGGAGLGARVALVERHLLGGDCLNVGCVPSKALIAAARAAASARRASALGVHAGDVRVDFPAVMQRMRRLRASIAPNDGVERFTSLGVDVFLGQGRFASPTAVEVDGRTLEFSRAVIAAGARAAAPSIPGLAGVDYLTNENLFWLTDLPRRLVVLGAGPIGCEMAQTFRTFGAEVTVVHADAHVLPREDADAAAVVQRRLVQDGVGLVHGARVTRVEQAGPEVVVHYQADGAEASVRADKVLVGVGRAPNLEGLGLEAAGVEHDGHGITVDDYLRTSNSRIYAAGDVASRFKFTHTADAAARIVLANTLFAGRKKTSALVVPWCTYTTPEIAHVGLYEHEAAERGIEVQRFTIPLAEVDRAILDGEDEGFLRVLTKKGGDQIVGATLVAAHAGDLISEVTLAMVGKIGLGTIAGVIHPYPTQAEAIRKAGDAYNRTRLTPAVKTLFRGWLRLRR